VTIISHQLFIVRPRHLLYPQHAFSHAENWLQSSNMV